MIAESLVTRPPVKIGVLISGAGTNLQAIIEAVARGELQADIRVVISNKAAARGLERARNHGIPAVVIDHRHFASRGEPQELSLNRAHVETFADLYATAGTKSPM